MQHFLERFGHALQGRFFIAQVHGHHMNIGNIPRDMTKRSAVINGLNIICQDLIKNRSGVLKSL